MAEEKIVLEFRNIVLIALLVILTAFFVLELQITVPSPVTFGDEAFHTGMARYIAQEKDYPKWVTISGTEFGRQNFAKPALVHLLEAGFFLVFGFNEIIVKFLFPFISFLTTIVIYIFVKRLFSAKVGLLAAIIFITIPSVVTYAVTFYAEGLVTFYFALAALLFIYSMKTGSKKYLILIGIFAAFAFLTEVSSVNLIIFILLAALYGLMQKHNFTISKYVTIFAVFFVITAGFFIRNLSLYGAPECYLPFTDKLYSKSGCNYGITIKEQVYQYQSITGGGGSDDSVYKIGILNYLDFAYGNLWLVSFGLFGGVLISLFRRDLPTTLLLLIILTILPYFPFTAARAEDAARNLLAWTPFIAIFAGIYFGRLYEFLESYQKYIPVVIVVLVLVIGFLNFSTKAATMKQVKRFSPAFFEACDWVKKNLPKDSVLATVWVYRAAYSCERTTVGNLPDIFISKNLTLIEKNAKDVGITHLFIQKFSLSDQLISEKYLIDSVLMFDNDTEHFKKVYENGPALKDCIQAGGCDGNIIYELKF